MKKQYSEEVEWKNKITNCNRTRKEDQNFVLSVFSMITGCRPHTNTK